MASQRLSPPMAAQSLPPTPPGISSSWSVFHRTSSAYNPHANCLAETAVKTTKRLIAGNTGPGGTLSDDFHQALLQYTNGPSPGTGMSPAQCLFGRATRDILPDSLPLTACTRTGHRDWTSVNVRCRDARPPAVPDGTNTPRPCPHSIAVTQS